MTQQQYENRAHNVTGEPTFDEWVALLMLGEQTEITLFARAASRDALQRVRSRVFAVGRPMRPLLSLSTRIYRDDLAGGHVLSIRVTPRPTDSHLGRERSPRIQEARHRSVRARALADVAGAKFVQRHVGAAARLLDEQPVADGMIRCPECGMIVRRKTDGSPRRHSLGMQGISTKLGPCRGCVPGAVEAARRVALLAEMSSPRLVTCPKCRREIARRPDGALPVHMDRRTQHACSASGSTS